MAILVLWPGIANADAPVRSMGGGARLLECAVVVEMFEPEEGSELPVDFAAAAEAIRYKVSTFHGSSFVEKVTRERRAYWEQVGTFDRETVDDLRELLPYCQRHMEALGF